MSVPLFRREEKRTNLHRTHPSRTSRTGTATPQANPLQQLLSPFPQTAHSWYQNSRHTEKSERRAWLSPGPVVSRAAALARGRLCPRGPAQVCVKVTVTALSLADLLSAPLRGDCPTAWGCRRTKGLPRQSHFSLRRQLTNYKESSDRSHQRIK